MKLHSIKLTGSYKSLSGSKQDPFYLRFKEARDFYTPICLVGLNGSGKSNLIELITDIFCFADRYFHESFSVRDAFPYDFELRYRLEENGVITDVTLFHKRQELLIKIRENGKWNTPERSYSYLPSKIVAYSSGHNQGLSSVLAKNQLCYFEAVSCQGAFYRKYNKLLKLIEGRDSEKDEIVSDKITDYLSSTYEKNLSLFHPPPNYQLRDDYGLDPNIPLDAIRPKLPIGVYSDHSANQMIFISLYVTKNKKFRKFLKNEIGIDCLVRFELDLRLREFREIGFVQEDLEKLIQLSSGRRRYNSDTSNGVLIFTLDDRFSSKLEELFLSSERFFNTLLSLTYLSARRWSPDEKKSLRTSKYTKSVPHVSGGYNPIRVVNTKIKIGPQKQETLYDRLSDGEHQLIQIIALLIMFENHNTLFILDEPESHFNPEWRSDFVAMIHKYVTGNRSEIVVSTHSPFLVSSCKGNRVFLCEKDKDKGQIDIDTVPEETYGASFDTLLKSVFNLSVLISRDPWEKIEEIKKGNNPEEIIQQLDKFGNSFEINYLKNVLRKKI